MTRCKYWDSGWCYAPDGVANNSFCGECNLPKECPYLMSQIKALTFDELVDKIIEDPPDSLKFTLGSTLYDKFCEFLESEDLSKPKSIIAHDLINIVKDWLPKEQSSEGSQNAYVECAVESYNDLLQSIRGKLIKDEKRTN